MQFSDIIGQDLVKKHLIRTVRESRVSHAQLFLGPEGSGNLPLAIAYAQYINCNKRTESDSCGVCPSCIKYNKLIHPDLHFLYPKASKDSGSDNKSASKVMVDQWRELVLESNGYFKLSDWTEKTGIERKQAIISTQDCSDLINLLSYKSYEAEYKVMVIWMVEKLFYAAAPKILKILEEPPDKTLFLLVSQSHERIISTILSRTQLVKIPPINENDLVEKFDKIGIEPRISRNAARVSAGNFIDALQMAKRPEEEEENFTRFTRWMRFCYKENFKDFMEFAGEVAKLNRDDQKTLLIYALRIMREAFLMGQKLPQLLRINAREEDFLLKFHPFIHRGNIGLISDEFNNAIAHVERNVNPNILFLDMSIRLGKYIKA